MNLISLARAVARRAAVLAVVFGAAGASVAADTPVVAAPVVMHAGVPCETCAAPAGVPCGPACAAAPGCRTHFGRVVAPYKTKLCPGACFGYFQTQWSKWEDVCPLPYQGQGFTDAPAQRTSPVTPVRPPAADPKKIPEAKTGTGGDKGLDPKFNKDKGSDLPPPRPGTGGTNPMPVGRSGAMPAIPQVPGNLPIPTGRFGS